MRMNDQRTIFVTLGSVCLVLALLSPGEGVARRVFGPVPLPVAVSVAVAAGWLSLGRLRFGGANVHWPWLLVLGAVLAVPAVAVDLALPFPDDLNMGLPGALAFYPAAGFVAEVAFHLVPLALMALLLRLRRLPAPAYLPAVLTEPLFQAAASGASLQGGLVAIHLTVFGAVQLWILRRHGFLAMYALRLVYYVFWHLLWGTIRLQDFP